MPANPPHIRILLVDDHPIVRQGLVQLIEDASDLHVHAEAESAGEALEKIRDGEADLVIVDLALPGPSGLELIKQIRAERADLPILVLSMHDERFYAERALRAGAQGYVMKQEAVEKVVEAIREVLRGEFYVSQAVAGRMLHKFIKGAPAEDASPVQHLSDRELEVFHLIGQGYSTRQVAELLHLSIKTIESYRANIKAKLHLKNASELVQYAVQWVQHAAQGTQLRCR